MEAMNLDGEEGVMVRVTVRVRVRDRVKARVTIRVWRRWTLMAKRGHG